MLVWRKAGEVLVSGADVASCSFGGEGSAFGFFGLASGLQEQLVRELGAGHLPNVAL
jgi:hypothetical protein